MKLFLKTVLIISMTLNCSHILAETICGYSADAVITVTSKNGEKSFFKVGTAETAEKHEKGLMHCKELKKGTGLFFVFNDDREHFFWMKNTLIELAIIYIDRDFKVVSVKKGKPMSEATIPSIYPSRYVFEVNWIEGAKILPGDKITFKMN